MEYDRDYIYLTYNNCHYMKVEPIAGEFIKIHKKHEDILNAWLEDNEVEIEFNGYLHGHRRWCNENNFMQNYEEDAEYRLKDVTDINVGESKNNFSGYDFEADFEGFIDFKTKDNYLIGEIKDVFAVWNEKGQCIFTDDCIKMRHYNLTPIKKEPRYILTTYIYDDKLGTQHVAEQREATDEEIEALKIKG